VSFVNRRPSSIVPSDDQLRPILDVCDELGIEHEPSGRDWAAAICPRHEDTNPSLRFNIPGNFFCCFGCSEGGSAAHFYRFITGCSLQEAVAATVRRDADALDDLSSIMESSERDDRAAVVAVQLLLAERLRDLDDDTLDIDEWARIMCESSEENLLTDLRAVV